MIDRLEQGELPRSTGLLTYMKDRMRIGRVWSRCYKTFKPQIYVMDADESQIDADYAETYELNIKQSLDRLVAITKPTMFRQCRNRGAWRPWRRRSTHEAADVPVDKSGASG